MPDWRGYSSGHDICGTGDIYRRFRDLWNRTITSTSGSGTSVATINLTGVTNVQNITVSLLGVSAGGASADIPVAIGVLLGDVNFTRNLDGNDVSAVQAKTRQAVGGTNFWFDVNTTGSIDGNDVSLTQSKTRTSLP